MSSRRTCARRARDRAPSPRCRLRRARASDAALARVGTPRRSRAALRRAPSCGPRRAGRGVRTLDDVVSAAVAASLPVLLLGSSAHGARDRERLIYAYRASLATRAANGRAQSLGARPADFYRRLRELARGSASRSVCCSRSRPAAAPRAALRRAAGDPATIAAVVLSAAPSRRRVPRPGAARARAGTHAILRWSDAKPRAGSGAGNGGRQRDVGASPPSSRGKAPDPSFAHGPARRGAVTGTEASRFERRRPIDRFPFTGSRRSALAAAARAAASAGAIRRAAERRDRTSHGVARRRPGARRSWSFRGAVATSTPTPRSQRPAGWRPDGRSGTVSTSADGSQFAEPLQLTSPTTRAPSERTAEGTPRDPQAFPTGGAHSRRTVSSPRPGERPIQTFSLRRGPGACSSDDPRFTRRGRRLRGGRGAPRGASSAGGQASSASRDVRGHRAGHRACASGSRLPGVARSRWYRRGAWRERLTLTVRAAPPSPSPRRIAPAPSSRLLDRRPRTLSRPRGLRRGIGRRADYRTMSSRRRPR